VAVRVEPRVHAIGRSRELCARALGYDIPGVLRFGLRGDARAASLAAAPATVAFVHGSSRADKCWPESHWVELGRRLLAGGFGIALPQGSDEERERAQRIAATLGSGAQVWPRRDLGDLTDALAACSGVVGVDSGLSHIAVALDAPHVQVYNFDTAWRTGPLPGQWRQRSVFASPTPSVDSVWQAWREVSPSR
jgi:heptosyltransferase-1